MPDVAIDTESIGWQPLGDGAYLHLGKPEEEAIVITVVGVPEVGMAGMNLKTAVAHLKFVAKPSRIRR